MSFTVPNRVISSVALVAYAGHAGYVVRRVPRERLVVHHLRRRQAVTLLERLLRHDVHLAYALAREQHVRRVVYELEAVAVAREYVGVDAVSPSERAYDVVRLPALVLDVRDAHLFQHLFEHGELRREIVGHALARGFVSVEHVVAEGLGLHVERHSDVARRILVDESDEHVRETVHRACGRAVLGGEQRQRVIRAVDQAVSVDEYEFFLEFHDLIISANAIKVNPRVTFAFSRSHGASRTRVSRTCAYRSRGYAPEAEKRERPGKGNAAPPFGATARGHAPITDGRISAAA